MAVPYYIYQDNRKNGTKLWYAKATHFGEVDERELARQAQKNCTLKESDCMAIVTEMLEVIQYELGNNNCVYLDGFGYFKPYIHSKGAVSKDKFLPAENILGNGYNFNPTLNLVGNTDNGRKFSHPWLLDLKLQRVSGPMWAKKKNV